MKTMAVEWQSGRIEGAVKVTNGRLSSISVAKGKGTVDGAGFTLTGPCPGRIVIAVDEEHLAHGADPTLIAVQTAERSFSFLLRDINAATPVWIPAYDVVVTEASDQRSYGEIAEELRGRHLQTALQRIATDPEESYERAAAATRKMHSPIWLGISRDIRIFAVAAGPGCLRYSVTAQDHCPPAKAPGDDQQELVYAFAFGRGIGCVEMIGPRHLEDGSLPILHGIIDDQEVQYHYTTFATLECSALTADAVRGTHYLVADSYAAGHMLTKEQQEQRDALLPEELDRAEETVLYYRVQATNTGQVPRYAWFQCPYMLKAGSHYQAARNEKFDGALGFRFYAEDAVYCVARLNGEPLPKAEVACLLQPGETATFEFRLPHRLISVERAQALASQDFVQRHAECRNFWRRKLATSTQFSLPERRIQEMLDAGKLHLDLITFGLEPDGTVAPTIGIYCPIGSESSPIMQYFDSVGWHDLARRSLQFFLDKQHEDGFIQNFGGYMLETGAALWSLGEHYRYTRDREWLCAVKPKLIKACNFILAWRERNKVESLRGKGYGMMEGKVADPEDPFHSFMLNGYGLLGISRVAEMLAEVDPGESQRLTAEATAFKQDLLATLRANFAASPVVPLGDGSWCPSVAPWAEARGPVSLLTDSQPGWTHGSFLVRDSLIGPLQLLLQEVVGVEEQIATWMLEYHADLFHQRNVAFSQPYYSEHALAHLRRGEVKAFLSAFYNGFTSLADREIYTFWEHYFGASPHKTHEEGWFLMQCRWLLYLEKGDTLRLLPGVPRAWLEHRKEIAVTNAASYFGPVSFRVVSDVELGRITASVGCASDRKPATIEFRLPHPDGRRAVRASGGIYDFAAESVRIDAFSGQANVMLEF